MKRNSRILQDDEIDLREIIKTLWNEKILILSISFIFMVIGYVYWALQPKIYKTEITLREAPSSLFEAYRLIYGPQQQQQQQQVIAKQFNDDLKLNLLSLDTLVQFVEETNTINDFKNHLKEKNINVRDYFRGKFKFVIDKNNNIKNKYSLTYSQLLPAEAFLNDYIIFVQQQTMTIFKKKLTQIVTSEINIHQQQLEIAKKIDLENPILMSKVEGRGVVNEPDALFYKGTKVLTQQIIYLNNLLNETKNLTLEHNPILEQASSGSLITPKSPIIYVATALLGGLFFSIMIIFIRSIMRI
jgi:LPS O-antigen subunit length determinant protein (WzzB/FepE family)